MLVQTKKSNEWKGHKDFDRIGFVGYFAVITNAPLKLQTATAQSHWERQS